jgi:hypothetical protein
MMTNEMMRPCTLWGETFDACDVKAVNDYLTFKEESAFPSGGHHGSVLIRDPFKGDISSPRFKTQRESYKAVLEAITAIADALNAPVLATDELIKDLPEGASFYCIENFETNRRYFPKHLIYECENKGFKESNALFWRMQKHWARGNGQPFLH